jgi:2-polyprenyl-3-methyl-5-hydroxy-6-metoxy-1,4-benzoquinol methylase
LLSLFGPGRDRTDAPKILIGAIARQCFNNEYVFAVGPAEDESVAALGREIEQAATKGSRAIDPMALLVYAMYEPLDRMPCADLVATAFAGTEDPVLDPVLKRLLWDTREEHRLGSEIKALKPIVDDVSQKVRAQYEENPYPRWLHAPQRPSAPFPALLKRMFPYLTPPAFLGGNLKILVAGCGTGRHPIHVAMRHPGTQILAVDLSRRSIAYGMRMAREMGIATIDFLQADILDLAELNGPFDIIESIGVLHHMKDPRAGLKVLAALLRPGGVIKLGLYSERAREVVVRARRHIAAAAIPADLAGIRRFRAAVLADGETGEFAQLLTEPDFYSVSTCRDLLFHAQEHRFTPFRIKTMIEGEGLRFLGFELGGAIPELYARYAPNDPDRNDLLSWDRFEAEHPGLIGGYMFWCQKVFGRP